jgi:hypothetical protein
MDNETLAILLSSVALVLVVGVFIGLLVGLFKLLRFLWARAPLAIVTTDRLQLGKLLGTIVALILTPRVAAFAWQTIRALAEFVPSSMGKIGSLVFSNSQSCRGDSSQCFTQFASSLTRILGEMAFSLVTTLNFPAFPIVDFLVFLLLALVFTQAFGLFLNGLAEGRGDAWRQGFNTYVPPTVRSRIVFTGLVIVASYLGLSALLAVSFFQSRTQAQQQYTYEALEKALTASLMSAEAFDNQFSKQLPELKSVTLPTLVADKDSRIATFFQDEQTRQAALYGRLQESWSILRVTAATLPQRLRDEAVSIFRSSSEGRTGGREAAEHFTKLILWHQQSSQETKDTLSACSSQATRLASGLSQVFENFRRDLQIAGANPTDSLRAYEAVVQNYLVGGGGARTPADYWESAFRACRIQSRAERADPPVRPPFGASLGVIGEWAGWLLRAESLPVVIIVGLVGFSLLGATVSRVVRRQVNAPSTGFTLDDLLLVIAGGTTAAFVIFLAAYGGLAVLGGGTTTDPNPYVVFVTCLVGAVYSEDVWQWARQRVLSSALTQNANNKAAGIQNQPGTGTADIGTDTGGTDGTAAAERSSISRDLDGLAAGVLKVRKVATDKMAAVDEAKRSQVETISSRVDEIHSKIVAAQDSAHDLTLPIDKVREAQAEAKKAAAQLDDLSTQLQAI